MRSALKRFALTGFALSRSALISSASERSALTRCASERSVLGRSAPVRFASDSSALERFASERFVPERSALVRFGSLERSHPLQEFQVAVAPLMAFWITPFWDARLPLLTYCLPQHVAYHIGWGG